MSSGPAPVSRVVVITGASSGIGRATALVFAARGDRLVLAARTASSLAEVAEQCRGLGADVVAVDGDVTIPGALESVVHAALGSFGRIDVWVGAASIFGYGEVTDMPRAVFNRILEVNLLAQIEGARAVLPHMRDRGSGVIVFVGSLFSKVSAPYLSAYVASKHGLLGFAESLRHEARRYGVKVSTILPATVDTPIYEHAANYTGRTVRPLPPLVNPRRVAAAIVRRADRPRPVTTVGVIQGLGWPLSLVARPVYGAVIRAAQRRIALAGPPEPASEGTVFVPDPPSNAIDGGWRGA